ncbi:MAG: RNA-guided endonuclease IscB [Ktedonobacterales bacterium]
MQRVFVIDQQQRPLMPCTPARARWLLTQKKAAIVRRYPFTIWLSEAKPEATVTPLRIKIDPGSKTTGLALVHEATEEVVWAGELTHRGQEVKQHVDQRRACRRSRRQRHTRYRQERFANRRRTEGWLPPSLESRVANVLTWIHRLRRWAPILAISVELVKFDTQLLQNAEISGVEYQQGELAGYEVREYLLEKWGRRCAYCGTTGCPIEIEHLVPRSRGGSCRVSNLTLACHGCNQQKGNQTAAEFGHPELQAHAKVPLQDAATMNSTRWALYDRLKQTGLPIETGTGGRTKYNRTMQQMPKTHWLDAANVGASTPGALRWHGVVPLLIGAQGWQRRQMCLVDPCGFPRTKAKRASWAFGFKTGDIVKAVVPAGQPHGTHVGKVAIKATGNFTITTKRRAIPDVPYRYCAVLHRSDGYSYQKGERAFYPIP